MNRLETSARRFVIDANVFVAALKPFSKPAKQAHKNTKALSLLIHLITDETIDVISNSRLVAEYMHLAEELNSKTSRLILRQLTAKITMVDVDQEALSRCKPYLPEKESAGIIHAATCLQTDAILITNDNDFNKIKHSGLLPLPM